MSSDILYSIFYSYNQKVVSKLNQAEDQSVEVQNLNVIELRDIIEPLKQKLTRFSPQRIKARLMLLMAALMMFFVSWKLTLVFFGCFLAIGVERLFCFRLRQKRKKECKNHIKVMNGV